MIQKGIAMKLFVYSLREFDELPYFEKYAREYNVTFDYTTEAPSPENCHLAQGYDAISIITTPTPAEMVDAMKENGVKVISTRTIGYDHIDVKHAFEVGMGITNVSYDPDSVADYTIMMMLIACRRIPYIVDTAKVKDYSLKGKIGKDLSHSTVGVIGTGRIGQTVIEHLSGFGCRILAYDIHPKEELKDCAEYVDLDQLYRESDIITLHAPALESNYHMVDEEAMKKMKERVILVNCARGQLIDTRAMIENLRNGRIGFAALDLVEDVEDIYYKDLRGEFLYHPQLDILGGFHNVFITPHTAFYTEQAVSDMVENSILGIQAYLNGEDHPYIVKKY